MPKTLSWSLIPVTLLVLTYFFFGYDYSGAAQNSTDTGINYSEVAAYFADMNSNIVDETALRANPISFAE